MNNSFDLEGDSPISVSKVPLFVTNFDLNSQKIAKSNPFIQSEKTSYTNR